MKNKPMKTTKLAVACALAVNFLVLTTANAQVLTPGGTIQGASVQGTSATGLSAGPLGQIKSGTFGTFNSNDNWAALGESPFGVNGVFPYGLRLQKQTQFGLFNLVQNIEARLTPQDLIVGWGQNQNAFVRFRFISNQLNNVFLDALTISSNGSVTAAGSVTSTGFFTSSDQRFKERVAAIENPLSMIRGLKGSTYQFRESGDFSGRQFPSGRQYGFIAQEVQKVLPEAVVRQNDGYYAVNYTAVIPVLVEAVKELDAKQAENVNLVRELAEVKAQLAELKELVSNKLSIKTADGNASVDEARVNLEQNAPNPFGEKTTIYYNLPDNATDAVLSVISLQGQTLKVFNSLKPGRNALQIEANTLPVGFYIYRLSVKGKEVVSRRLEVTK